MLPTGLQYYAACYLGEEKEERGRRRKKEEKEGGREKRRKEERIKEEKVCSFTFTTLKDFLAMR